MTQPVENTVVNTRRERRGRGSRRRLAQSGGFGAMLSIDLSFEVSRRLAVTRAILANQPEQVLPRVAAMLYAVAVLENIPVWWIQVGVETPSHTLQILEPVGHVNSRTRKIFVPVFHVFQGVLRKHPGDETARLADCMDK